MSRIIEGNDFTIVDHNVSISLEVATTILLQGGQIQVCDYPDYDGDDVTYFDPYPLHIFSIIPEAELHKFSEAEREQKIHDYLRCLELYRH